MAIKVDELGVDYLEFLLNLLQLDSDFVVPLDWLAYGLVEVFLDSIYVRRMQVDVVHRCALFLQQEDFTAQDFQFVGNTADIAFLPLEYLHGLHQIGRDFGRLWVIL